jgi:hypothetical protein
LGSNACLNSASCLPYWFGMQRGMCIKGMFRRRRAQANNEHLEAVISKPFSVQRNGVTATARSQYETRCSPKIIKSESVSCPQEVGRPNERSVLPACYALGLLKCLSVPFCWFGPLQISFYVRLGLVQLLLKMCSWSF